MTDDTRQTNPSEHKIVVLLVDDQPIIGEAIRRILLTSDDIKFHYCRHATEALQRAAELRHRYSPGLGDAARSMDLISFPSIGANQRRKTRR